MPTTFNVISLGIQADIDTTEGNNIAEGASALVGSTFGSLGDSLNDQIQTFSPGSTGFAGGTTTAYDMDNNVSSETFSIDGGPDQTFDGTSIYNATITYIDGTTATITAVIFQDTNGNTYLAPEFSANADQAALEAQPIRSITLDSLSGNTFSGLTGDRQTGNFAVCFAEGTLIRTPFGDRPVQSLIAGDLVETADNGAQPIRWIGGRSVPAIGPMAPIAFAPGSLGSGLPRRRMMLSRHHRVMLRNAVANRMTGIPEVLVPAHRLEDLGGVCTVQDLGFVTYWHFLCDNHEIVFAEGTPAETLYLGTEAKRCLTPEALEEVRALFPDLVGGDASHPAARTLMDGARGKTLIQRLQRNRKPAVAPV